MHLRQSAVFTLASIVLNPWAKTLNHWMRFTLILYNEANFSVKVKAQYSYAIERCHSVTSERQKWLKIKYRLVQTTGLRNNQRL
jgi:hypothetical protein